MQLNNQDYEGIRESIKQWIMNTNKEEVLPQGIIALNFGLYEPYGIELIGSKEYDPNDDDWACEEDFVPNLRDCPNINVSSEIEWEEFLNIIVSILKELTTELKDLEILKVKHITTGFCDGDLVVVR